MTAPCLVCLGDTRSAPPCHARCLRDLFGTSRVPAIDVELAKLHTLALAMVGHTSISGVQRKLSVGLSPKKTTLQVQTEGGRYILKPQSQTYPELPENEHLTMRIAKLARIEIPSCGLVRLRDGTWAYTVKRFDRLDDGRKLLQEDFCQLAERSPKEKYQGSAELCGRLVLRHASEPIVEALKLFRLMVFSWWTGNGDMHLKNFSLLRGEDGLYRLSPAYDLLSTQLVIPGDQLALPVVGKRKNITRRRWLELAESYQVRPRAAGRVLQEIVRITPAAEALIERSALSGAMQARYRSLIREHTAVIEGA